MHSGPIIKICGLSTPETLEAAIAAGADWIGLVHYSKSPRHVEGRAAADLAGQARGRAVIVALTVDADDQTLEAIVRDVAPDIFQFHGKETPERVAAVKARFGRPVMKALGVESHSDLAGVAPYGGIADHLLLDAKPPKGAVLPGGNGTAFDWAILKGLPAGLTFMLSGGLTPETVAEAIRRTRPFGVDVSSGVECAPGVKDSSMIERFIAAARGTP